MGAEGGREGWIPRCKYCGVKWPALKIIGISICSSCAYEIAYVLIVGSTARAMQSGKKKKPKKKKSK